MWPLCGHAGASVQEELTVKIKTGFNLLAILALLAFGPRENRDFFFRPSPDQLYGEFEIFRDGQDTFWVARNASPEKVELLGASPVHVWSTDLKNRSFYTSETERFVYAESMAVVKRKANSLATAPSVRIGKVQPQIPRGLRFVTEAEEFYEFLWPLIIVVLAVTLTYLINDLSWECGSPIRDIIKAEEQSS